MEALLERLVPGLSANWQGASEAEIEQIEVIAGRPLPRFYRWFLMRMGRSMGRLAYQSLDFSARKVLTSYAEELFVPHPRFLMIGHESDEIMPLHVLYDLDFPARDDARVTKRHALGGASHHQFATFREMLAWGKFLHHGVEAMPQRCSGSFVDDGGDVLAHLDPVMASLGFKKPIPSGSHCALYEGASAAMATSATPGDEPRIHFFDLGGHDVGRLRRTLGVIGTETPLEVKISRWTPPHA